MDMSVSPSVVTNIISRAARVKRPLFIWGPPGIGKSEIVEDFTYNVLPGNNFMIDCRLALMEPNDLRGYPWRNPETNTMEWSPPVDLPSEQLASQYDNIVLFLDELNSAPPMVQAAAYQLILNRRIGQYRLPDNVIMIAAGNRENDRGVTYKMPGPLANRFRHVGMEANFGEWQKWAIRKGIHSDVIGFLSYNESNLFKFDRSNASTAWASPRTWTFVSEILSDHDFDLADPLEQKAEVAGAVGEGMAGEFLEHRRVAKLMPKPAEILEGTVKSLDSKLKNEISAKYSMIVATSYELNKRFQDGATSNELKDMLNHSIRFMFNNADPEMIMVFLRTIMKDYNIPFKMRETLDKDLQETFRDRYTKYLV